MNAAEARSRRAREHGSSVLVILVLLACIAVILATNSTALALFKREIQIIDRQQQQRYGQGPGH